MWLGSSAKETEPDNETDGNRKDNEEDNPDNGHTHSNTHHVHCMEERKYALLIRQQQFLHSGIYYHILELQQFLENLI